MTNRVVDAERVKLRVRVSKYQAIADKVNDLRVGKAYVVETPDDVDPEAFRNRLNTGVRPLLRNPRKGWKFMFRMTENDDVAITYTRVPK
jgi:hypothetical protein